MDYKASGAPKLGKNAPKHAEHNAHGSKKKPFGERESKAELLARMKAAQADKTSLERFFHKDRCGACGVVAKRSAGDEAVACI